MRALSPAFALLMIAAGALGAVGIDVAAVGVAVVAVAAGVRWAGAATLAVGCVVVQSLEVQEAPAVCGAPGADQPVQFRPAQVNGGKLSREIALLHEGLAAGTRQMNCASRSKQRRGAAGPVGVEHRLRSQA